MKYLDYQTKAVHKLHITANDLLNLEGNHTLVFKAPTGSGKTVMIAEFLREFVSNRTDDKEFAFIWAAPRNLHLQSKEKLQKHFKESKSIKCSDFDDLTGRLIEQNEILFLNWESINREDNIYYRENEQEFYLEKIIQNTKDKGKYIILIIDESHHTAGAENTQGLIAMINARLTIEVSATPPMSGDAMVPVYREKVIEEGMIKKRIVINPDFKNIVLEQLPSGEVKVKSTAEESTNEFVIRKALDKRLELVARFNEEGSLVNPLMLIQLPDRRPGQENVKDEVVKILKENHNITIENGKLAVYLADEKERLTAITQNDSPVEVMIFKQAIALGWDCPRASILVLFRDWRSIVFSIQTVGRIMRMAELKHYLSDELNVGYIYTNLSDISIHQDIADGYATVYHSKRNNEIYKDINLLSCHSLRQRERTRLTPKFIEFFLNAANDLDLKKKISIKTTQITRQLISNGIVSEPDVAFDHLSYTDLIDRVLNEEEIQRLFDQFSVESLSPELFPEERSLKRINKSIYEFFKNEYPRKFEYGSAEEQIIVLAESNRQHFLDVINLAKVKYLADVEKLNKEIIFDENWEIPNSRDFTEEFINKDYELSIMQPFYERRDASNIEKDFAEFLNNKKKEIIWWFKNGERDGTFFAVPRKERDDNVPFYVDWIVQYKDGRIGLFDTKAGLTAETAGTRAEGLARYIIEQNEKGKKLFGGIVTQKNQSFWYNDKVEYQYDENRLSELGWKIL